MRREGNYVETIPAPRTSVRGQLADLTTILQRWEDKPPETLEIVEKVLHNIMLAGLRCNGLPTFCGPDSVDVVVQCQKGKMDVDDTLATLSRLGGHP